MSRRTFKHPGPYDPTCSVGQNSGSSYRPTLSKKLFKYQLTACKLLNEPRNNVLGGCVVQLEGPVALFIGGANTWVAPQGGNVLRDLRRKIVSTCGQLGQALCSGLHTSSVGFVWGSVWFTRTAFSGSSMLMLSLEAAWTRTFIWVMQFP